MSIRPDFDHHREFSAPPAPPSAASIASLVLGILSWVCLPFIGPIAAVIAGHVANGEIRRNPRYVGGRAFALIGLVLGYAQLALIALAVVGLTVATYLLIGQSSVVPPPPVASRPIEAGAAAGAGDDAARVVACVAEVGGKNAAEIDRGDPLGGVGIDDGHRIDLIIRIEGEFRIKLRPGESSSWRTVGDVICSVESRGGLAPSPAPTPGGDDRGRPIEPPRPDPS